LLKYDKVEVIVFAKTEELRKYFNLFRLMLNKDIETCNFIKEYAEIITDNMRIRFAPANGKAKGYRAHYVLNLTQDEIFDICIVRPITIIHDHLRDDPRWSILFK
jgi:hypothetical protein